MTSRTIATFSTNLIISKAVTIQFKAFGFLAVTKNTFFTWGFIGWCYRLLNFFFFLVFGRLRLFWVIQFLFSIGFAQVNLVVFNKIFFKSFKFLFFRVCNFVDLIITFLRIFFPMIKINNSWDLLETLVYLVQVGHLGYTMSGGLNELHASIAEMNVMRSMAASIQRPKRRKLA